MTIYFDKYKKFGAYHWDWYEMKPRYKAHVDRIVALIADKTILDVGAGDGFIAHMIGAVGVDNDVTAVNLAVEKGVDVRLASAYSLPFDDNSFDAVLISDTLEHLEFPEKAITEARRVLRDHLYLSGPLAGGILEEYEYEASVWDREQIKENVEKLGFQLQGSIYHKGRKGRAWFYAKFKKV